MALDRTHPQHFAPESQQGGPSFDTLGGAVQHPGTIRPGEPEGQMVLHHETNRRVGVTQDTASDKFAVHSLPVLDLQAHQLLPADPNRKIARIAVVEVNQSYGIYIGTLASISNFAGNQTALVSSPPPGCYLIGAQSIPSSYQYTSKAPLYFCAATNVDPANEFVQCMVEMFNEGTPVT